MTLTPTVSSSESDAMTLPGLSYVVSSLDPGGAEKLVIQMSVAFAKDFRIQVLCLDVPGAWAADLRRFGIPVHCLWRQPGIDLAMSWQLARHFRAHRTHIVHAHQCTPWFYCALARLFYRKPKLLLEEHGRFYPDSENQGRILVNRILIRTLTDRFVAVSKDIGMRLVRYEGLKPADVQVIYNGVAPAQLLLADEREELRRALGFAAGCFVIGTVGRFDPIKNLPMLVQSLAAAGREEPLIRGLLVGDGPVIEDIRHMVEQSSMRDRIRLTGYRDDARCLTQCMDLFVLASFSEGTSMALLEAMAAGIPAVVTEVGGNPEIVLNGLTGWIVPSGATSVLAQTLLEAVREADRRTRFAEAGRRRFEEQFRMSTMIENYRRLYAELLAPRFGQTTGIE